MEQRKRVLTREELHELVWSTPILKLSQEYGLSDRGLGKICARHLVPTPPRGYWAKLEAGQPVKKTPLRSVENEALHKVQIGPANGPSEAVLAALAAAKSERKRLTEERKQKAEDPASNPRNTDPLVADQPIAVLHKAITPVVKQLLKAKPNSDGVVSAKGVCVHERTRERAIRILHHLATIAEDNGAGLTFNERGLHISTSEGSLHFVLTEERKRPKHIPTEAEIAEYQRLKAKREKERDREFWSFGRSEPWPEFDIVYTGKLTIGYDGYRSLGLRKSWSDGKTQTVERCLVDFVVGMRTIISARAEEDRKTAEQERIRQAMRRRRELAHLRSEREDKRSAYLEEIALARRKVADLQTTIAVIPQTEEIPPEYGRMISWARERLAELEARTTIEAIQEALREQNLFPEPDELFDPEGEPPPKKNYWDD